MTMKRLYHVIVLTTLIISITQIHKRSSPNNSQPPPSSHHRQLKEKSSSGNSLPISWLLTYPGSGSHHILQLISSVSQVTTGTNYGASLCSSPEKPPGNNAITPQGPFIRNALPMPSGALVTESHCTGYSLANDSGMTSYYSTTKELFYQRCGVGNKSNCRENDDNGTIEERSTRYKADGVRLMIHIIRNPFENIVERYRMEYDERRRYNDPEWNDKEMNRENFHAWCTEQDEAFAREFRDWEHEDVAELAALIPCHGILYQYVKWHNSVWEMMGQYGHRMKALHLHLEDFEQRLEEVVPDMISFLNLPFAPTTPLSSLSLSTPPINLNPYFSDHEKIQISSFFKIICSQKTWTALSTRYLPPPDMEQLYAPVGPILSPQFYGTWPHIAWLMSFPNSGTYYTTMLVQTAGRYTLATNYGPAVGINFKYTPNFAYSHVGPFRFSPRPFAEDYVLTLTHCAGHCTECAPEEFQVDPDEFLVGCGRGSKYNGDMEHMVRVQYHPSLAKRVVHLMRDPFDNVVSRFHHAYVQHRNSGEGWRKEGGEHDGEWNYSYSREGFRSWCAGLDERFLNSELMEYIPAGMDVPCLTIFHQYVQWHNNAFTVPETLKVPSIVIHYEDYHFDITGTMNTLFHFLNIQPMGRVKAFEYHPYVDYYTEEERLAVTQFLINVASDDTKKALQRYFEVQLMST